MNVKPNVEQCSLLVPLGYSPVMNEEGEYLENVQALRSILGEFKTIRFETIRLAEEFFEVTIVTSKLGFEHTQTVGGKIGDRLKLENGEWLVIERFGSQSCNLSLLFLTPE